VPCLACVCFAKRLQPQQMGQENVLVFGYRQWPSAQSFLLVRRGSALLLWVELTRLECNGVVE
jgi:hypothetical protein